MRGAAGMMHREIPAAERPPETMPTIAPTAIASSIGRPRRGSAAVRVGSGIGLNYTAIGIEADTVSPILSAR